MRIGSVTAFVFLGLPCLAATFGTLVPQPGGFFSDIVLDEFHKRVYLVNTTANRIDVYRTDTNPPRALNPIRTGTTPLSAAISRSGKFLYVTAYGTSSLNIIDLDKLTVTSAVTLPATPEGVAVGADERVLISTIGTGTGASTLLVYDPSASALSNLFSVVLTPSAPTPPTFPPPNGRIYNSARSALLATQDGRYIIGVNGQANNTRTVFVYETSSATVLRSRNVTSLSNVLGISPDGSKFMAGSTLFDTETLAVLAQQNAANAQFAFPGGAANNFNLQQNQGGSVFSPDGSTVYSAFNIAPVQNPPARPNVSRFLLNDPDNLYIRLGLQAPENLTGKMVITSDGATVYALSESGFLVLPVSAIFQQPIAMPESPVVLLSNDQCGVTAQQQAGTVNVKNIGGGSRMTVSAQLLQLPPTGPFGLGGFGGPGGGGPGGNIIIILPPIFVGGGGAAGGGRFAGGNFAPVANQAGIAATAPQIQMTPSPSGSNIKFNFNPNAARSLGTVSPHDFLIQSPEAINIPPDIRVYQNNRNAESSGAVVPVSVGVSASEGLMELLADNTRRRLYVANSGLNRIEVFDMQRQTFMNPIKVGQLPHSMALGQDGITLYVANTGSETISVVDLDKGQTVGTIKFPPIPFNSAFSLITPSILASSQRGLQVIMSDGTLWKVVGNTAVPRTLNPNVFGTTRTIPGPVRTMASTPGGENVLLLAGNGTAYLYDAQADDYIASKPVVSTPIQGYFGPVAAGPRGQYYLVNGLILNQSLTPIGSSTTSPTPGPVPGGGGALPTPAAQAAATTRPISAVAVLGNNSFVRFSQPIRTNQNQLPSDAGVLEMVDVASGRTMLSANALEGPLATGTANQRINYNGRTMAVNPAGDTAYVITTAGLSVIPLTQPSPQNRVSINPNGAVSTASYLPSTAPGGLVSIFGQNLAASASTDPANSSPLPAILGGSCVTLNNQPLPLIMTSPGQINVQIPPTLPAGRYPLVVRSVDHQTASPPMQLTVARYSPAVFVDGNGQPAIYHMDGTPVNKDAPANRDEELLLYATGLGATKGGKVATGMPAPSNPLAVTDRVQVFFGNPGYKQAEMIVEWSGLLPGTIGVYQIRLRVPGAHINGDAVPVTLRIGGVNSPSSGPAVPHVAVQ